MLSEDKSMIFLATTPAGSGQDIVFSADDEVRSAVAEELDLLEIEALKVDARVVRWQKQGLKVSGTLNANLKQACVSTLEPVEQEISLTFERRFLPEGAYVRKHEQIEDGELVIDPEAEDEPDELPPGGVNLWDTIIEEIDLALDPFPRAGQPDVEESPVNEDDAEEDTYRPFADLNSLINEKKSKN